MAPLSSTLSARGLCGSALRARPQRVQRHPAFRVTSVAASVDICEATYAEGTEEYKLVRAPAPLSLLRFGSRQQRDVLRGRAGRVAHSLSRATCTCACGGGVTMRAKLFWLNTSDLTPRSKYSHKVLSLVRARPVRKWGVPGNKHPCRPQQRFVTARAWQRPHT